MNLVDVSLSLPLKTSKNTGRKIITLQFLDFSGANSCLTRALGLSRLWAVSTQQFAGGCDKVLGAAAAARGWHL